MSVTEIPVAPAVTTTRPELDEVLREVNRIRTARGGDPIYELPKGARCHAFSCPLARGIGDDCGVGSTTYDFLGVAAGPLPWVLIEFRQAFDAGDFPELEL